MHKLIVMLMLGITEGLTEFFPISSTGHILLISYLLNCVNEMTSVFAVITQLGAILSIVLIFWYRLYYMGTTCIIKLFSRKHYGRNHLCIRHMLIGTLPGIILGAVFFEKIKLIFDLIYVVYGLIVGGIFLLIIEWCLPITKSYASRIDDITWVQAFLIGCFQCLAFWPGFSRAAATIGGGLLVGLNRRVSLEFSFFLAIPITFGASILTLYHYGSLFSIRDIMLLFVGCLSAFCVAVFTVRFFLKIVQNVSLIFFVLYRFVLAGIIYWSLII